MTDSLWDWKCPICGRVDLGADQDEMVCSDGHIPIDMDPDCGCQKAKERLSA